MSSGKESFRVELCLPFLFGAQNPDGGWGFRSAAQSSVEPTCWVLLALAQASDGAAGKQAVARGEHWLGEAQLADGSWPAFAGQREGCWVTSLACLALDRIGGRDEAVSRGMRWLCDAWPAEARLWWRLQNRFRRRANVAGGNYSLYGWSWTRGTASWVEPTSYALILLRAVPAASRPSRAAERIRLAQAMLYDRMCAGGGWNCGNPLVYGVPGEANVVPTALALLALQDQPERAENRASLEWLERACGQIQGPASLALAHICLAAYGRATPALEPALRELYRANQFLGNVQVMAWAALALQGGAIGCARRNGKG